MLAGSPLLLMRCVLSRCVVDTQLMTATFPLCMDFARMCSKSTITVLSMLGLACSCYCLAVSGLLKVFTVCMPLNTF